MDPQTAPHIHSIFYYLTGGSAGVSCLWWLTKRVVSDKVLAAKTAWNEVVSKIDMIADTTRVQATNHLEHIQAESTKQTGLLEEVVKCQIETNSRIGTLVDILIKKV
jgi:hypothetical protein